MSAKVSTTSEISGCNVGQKKHGENSGDRGHLATPWVLDFSFPVQLSWPEEHWYTPQTFEEMAQQEAVRSARAQGLPDRIEDPTTVSRLATLWRAG